MKFKKIPKAHGEVAFSLPHAGLGVSAFGNEFAEQNLHGEP